MTVSSVSPTTKYLISSLCVLAIVGTIQLFTSKSIEPTSQSASVDLEVIAEKSAKGMATVYANVGSAGRPRRLFRFEPAHYPIEKLISCQNSKGQLCLVYTLKQSMYLRFKVYNLLKHENETGFLIHESHMDAGALFRNVWTWGTAIKIASMHYEGNEWRLKLLLRRKNVAAWAGSFIKDPPDVSTTRQKQFRMVVPIGINADLVDSSSLQLTVRESNEIWGRAILQADSRVESECRD